ncbi:iron complex outermembrane recepter protein [Novosphingobium sp. CF614]|uniref:TonB-dependent receptor n=1 Tax=Novosphingobium sp. CF614 TaxID=1884364 RepID=UPI0008F016B6|nr:TonB-dependent receptor [Novosphingobium sp. CF614]SFF83761.1 iron complex outermembrane recepter protein [Novosphingobium sp. CF614]
MISRAILLAGASSAALFTVPALAREAVSVKSASTESESTAPQQHTSAGTGADDTGDTIFVTARHRTESSQEVPLAISVVGGDHIDATGSFNVGRLQQLTPTLQFYSSNPRNTAVNIRGIGVPFGLTNDGIEQGVGIYVDDVYYSRVASATFDFLDVAQIEVLRGPQGTLYGKNTTAGAINITTRQPTDTFEGRAEVSVGNLGFKQAKAAVSGPLSDRLSARIAMSATNRHGTIHNVTTDRQINEQDNLGLRAQVLWKPTDSLKVTLAGDYSYQNPECCGTVYVRTGLTQRALNRQYAALAAAQGYAVPSTDPYDRLTDLDASLNARNKMGGTSLRAVLDTAAGTLTSVTAWRFWDWKPANDRDFTGLPITTLSQNPSKQDQYTQELRFNHEGDKLGFVFGAFGFYQKVVTTGTQRQGTAASAWLLNPSSALSKDPAVLDGLTAANDIRLKNTSAALFGQVSWKVTDRLTIQPGARLNYDKKDGYYNSVVTNGAGQPVTFASTDPRIVAQRGVLAPQFFTARFSDWNFSYDLNVSYKVRPGVLLYATYAKSFKSGGVNLNGLPADASGAPLLAAATVKPESVDHYEAGIKTEFWDGKAILNISAFRTEIADYQALVTNGQLGVLRGYLANADKVRTQGAEWDFSVRPSERFNAYVNGAYTDATYRKFVDAPCPPELSGGTTVTAGQTASAPGTPGGFSPESCDISGQRLPGVSKWSLSWGAEGNVPAALLGQDGQVYLGVDGNYRSRFSSNPSPSDYTWIRGYALTNVRLGFRTDKGFDVFGWVRNAFDMDYFEQLQVPSGNTGLIVGNPGDPRTWGFTIKAEF